MASETSKEALPIRDLLLQALDDLVSVNSLFTVAVFLGLAFASPDQHSLETHRPHCDPDEKMGKRLVVCEVVSFSSFLLSSLVAKSMKVYINIFYSYKSESTSSDTNLPQSSSNAAATSITQNFRSDPQSSSLNADAADPLKEGRVFHPIKGLMFALSMLASIFGVLFLTISMAYVVEIKIGRLSCGITETQAAIMALTVLVPFGLLTYLVSMSLAVFYSLTA
ncbi:hypothetical protein JCGZ_15084 [Jatropha curcas]|uniref:Uncharacterized protein n=1 Tax=Jatropha curcas TaxID=180498 RepID=A0A067LLK2_JATCU|nr:uncharacterized protein LOC105644009 [Jatropha curcas]KDP45219.1 hypothetical protein JCGZ_15084 [Jatropha curcas]